MLSKEQLMIMIHSLILHSLNLNSVPGIILGMDTGVNHTDKTPCIVELALMEIHNSNIGGAICLILQKDSDFILSLTWNPEQLV